MPLTRPVFDYPFPRLLYRVLLDLHGWVDQLYVPVEQQPAVEHDLVTLWQLEEAIQEGVLRRYHFFWSLRGHLRHVKLCPADQHRRSPGIKLLKDLLQERGGVDIVARKRGKNKSAA